MSSIIATISFFWSEILFQFGISNSVGLWSQVIDYAFLALVVIFMLALIISGIHTLVTKEKPSNTVE
jgi:hypothetical protein